MYYINIDVWNRLPQEAQELLLHNDFSPWEFPNYKIICSHRGRQIELKIKQNENHDNKL